ncbi:hypothetical protein BD413DRAFT_473680 [Trametes elegans]|nr:hypothetical protein BD413DRAFT_473680 [Trametes elegans]
MSSLISHPSLTPWPRYYETSAPREYRFQSIHPIIAASECVSIVRRMGPMPKLTSLELVYQVDEADERLLQYVVHQYPALQDFLLHWYRADDTPVDCVHIARTITSLTLLRTMRLHLNFPEESIVYCTISVTRKAWYDTLTECIGWEIVEIVQACPLLEHVGLLYHGDPVSL